MRCLNKRTQAHHKTTEIKLYKWKLYGMIILLFVQQNCMITSWIPLLFWLLFFFLRSHIFPLFSNASLDIFSDVFQMGREKVSKFYWIVNISRSIAIRKSVIRNVHTLIHRSMRYIGGRKSKKKIHKKRNFIVTVCECQKFLKHQCLCLFATFIRNCCHLRMLGRARLNVGH